MCMKFDAKQRKNIFWLHGNNLDKTVSNQMLIAYYNNILGKNKVFKISNGIIELKTIYKLGNINIFCIAFV